MMRALFVACVVTSQVAAQTPVGIAAVDSAYVARAAWTRAIRADDLTVSRREIARASAAWPTQQSYLWGRALFAARARDTAGTLSALAAYADLGLGRDLSPPEFDFTRALPTFKRLAARHDDNRSPLVRSDIVRQLHDSTFWPEGIDYDPVDRSYYLAGVRHGTVARVDSSGGVTQLWPGDSLRLGAVMGVRVDRTQRILWVTTSGVPQNATFQPRDTALASLLKVDLASGRILRVWDFPVAPGGHVLGDLAIGPEGDIWISDSMQPVLYRLRNNTETIESYRSPLFRSLQGVAPSPDGSKLFIADFSHGLLRMDLPSGNVSRLGDVPHSTSLGCDGLAWYHGSIIAVQNGVIPARVVRFHLAKGERAIERVEVIDRNVAIADEPTIGTIVGDRFVYVANSQWEKHDDAGRPRAGARLTPTVLLAVPLK
jgi:streptogramin lyase